MQKPHLTPDAPTKLRFIWVLIAAGLCLVPVLVTPVLPMIDFYAHVARYHIMATIGQDPTLSQNYQVTWRLLPNLGMDVLGTGVMKFLPPLLAAKVLAVLIILAPFAGTLYLARSLQGRVTLLSVALAGILTFNIILAWGFANFLLGLGLALGGLGWWVGHSQHPTRQFWGAALLAIVLLFIHGLVFGLWGLMLGMIEIMIIAQSRPVQVRRLAIGFSRLVLIAAVPVILFFQMKTVSAEGGVTVAFTNLQAYTEKGRFWARIWDEILQRLDGILRVAETSWPMLDRGFGLVLWGGLAFGVFSGRLQLNRRVWLAVALAALLVWIIPPNMFGVGHLDERMPLLLLCLLAAGLCDTRTGQGAVTYSTSLAALFVLHVVMASIGWAQDGQSYRQYLFALTKLGPANFASTAFIGAASERDASRSCMPLLYLMLLKNGIPVATFANPTQQPLALIGPLNAAEDRRIAAEDLMSINAPAEIRLAALTEAGYDTIVTCDLAPPVTQASDASPTLIAADGKWAIYQTAARVAP